MMYLVPCRWEPNGWRYVTQDPGRESYFNNPNRMFNNFGVSPVRPPKFGQDKVSEDIEMFYKTANKSAFRATKSSLA